MNTTAIVTDLFGQSVETQEQQTRQTAVNTQAWAEWFKIELVDDNVERMVRAAAEWAIAVKAGDKPRWLSLLGSSGAGKTHLAKRLWAWLAKRPDFQGRANYLPQFVYWPKLMDDMRTDASLYSRFGDMQRWRYLVLDDVLAERQSDWTLEKINTLLGCRVGKWTILTSNLSMMGIAKTEKRIASRLIRDKGIVADIQTTDYNLRNR